MSRISSQAESNKDKIFFCLFVSLERTSCPKQWCFFFFTVFLFLNLGHQKQEPNLHHQRQHVPVGTCFGTSELGNSYITLWKKHKTKSSTHTSGLISLCWLKEVKHKDSEPIFFEGNEANKPFSFCHSSEWYYTPNGVTKCFSVFVSSKTGPNPKGNLVFLWFRGYLASDFVFLTAL